VHSLFGMNTYKVVIVAHTDVKLCNVLSALCGCPERDGPPDIEGGKPLPSRHRVCVSQDHTSIEIAVCLDYPVVRKIRPQSFQQVKQIGQLIALPPSFDGLRAHQVRLEGGGLVATEDAFLPSGSSERFAGDSVIGLRFQSGHVLVLQWFPASSLAPGYTSIRHRDPGGKWTFYSTVEPEQSCSSYFCGTRGALFCVDSDPKGQLYSTL